MVGAFKADNYRNISEKQFEKLSFKTLRDFLFSVESYPCLWDIQDEFYRNPEHTQSALSGIEYDMKQKGYSAIPVSAVWEELKMEYHREKADAYMRARYKHNAKQNRYFIDVMQFMERNDPYIPEQETQLQTSREQAEETVPKSQIHQSEQSLHQSTRHGKELWQASKLAQQVARRVRQDRECAQLAQMARETAKADPGVAAVRLDLFSHFKERVPESPVNPAKLQINIASSEDITNKCTPPSTINFNNAHVKIAEDAAVQASRAAVLAKETAHQLSQLVAQQQNTTTQLVDTTPSELPEELLDDNTPKQNERINGPPILTTTNYLGNQNQQTSLEMQVQAQTMTAKADEKTNQILQELTDKFPDIFPPVSEEAKNEKEDQGDNMIQFGMPINQNQLVQAQSAAQQKVQEGNILQLIWIQDQLDIEEKKINELMTGTSNDIITSNYDYDSHWKLINLARQLLKEKLEAQKSGANRPNGFMPYFNYKKQQELLLRYEQQLIMLQELKEKLISIKKSSQTSENIGNTGDNDNVDDNSSENTNKTEEPKDVAETSKNVLELASRPRASSVGKECAKACITFMYQVMFEVCCENGPPNTNSVQFWFDFPDYMMRLIEDDQNTYTNILNQFPQELNVGQLSASTLWQLYKTDLKLALDEHASQKKCATRDYMNLYFKVKDFYFKYVAEMPQYKQSIPEFPAWFIPFVMDWLNENQEHSMDILRNAYNRDKNDNFPQTSDHTKFSYSVVDVFTLLNEALKLLKHMDCPNPELYADMMKRFSKTLNKVLLAYADMVQKDFPKFATNEKLACILMNNVQQLRIELEKIYENMGGAELDGQASQVLTSLQKKLNSVLDKLSAQFVETLKPHIEEQTNKLGLLLTNIKGPQQQKSQVNAEVDLVLEPLMDLLGHSLQRYAEQCEKTVLKDILKELWRITIMSLEKLVVLPPLGNEKALLRQLPNTTIGDVTKLMSSNISNIKGMSSVKDMVDQGKDMERSLTPKQCTVLDAALDVIKESFHAGGQGLKKSFFEKSPELQSLKYALSLYTQTTDQLIKTFITTQKNQDQPSLEQPVGEVSVQADLFTHPATGEQKVSVKHNVDDNSSENTNKTEEPKDVAETSKNKNKINVADVWFDEDNCKSSEESESDGSSVQEEQEKDDENSPSLSDYDLDSQYSDEQEEDLWYTIN